MTNYAILQFSHSLSTDSVVITDLEGTIVYVNPVFERNTGYTNAEAIGKKPSILKSGKHDAEYYNNLWFSLKNRGSWSGILINKRKDRTLFEEETCISTVSDSKGAPAYYVAVKRDVTKERHLEEQLRQAQKMEAIGQLTGGIAHDFNNFLTAILGFSGLLQMKADEDKDAQSSSYLQNIISAAEKAANMTSSLLAFSRKRIINIRPVILNDIIIGIEKLLQRVITENVEFKTSLTDKGTIIMADAGQIEQVLLNLVANGRDAMPKGGTVFIKTEIVNIDEAFVRTHGYGKPGAYAALSVSDTGIGLDEKTKERIFEPFFTTKEVGKGTGLGLSIVYGIVRQHNGYIEVNSELGKGTTFNIYLPIIESTLEPSEAKKKAIPKGGKETILLAEDELEVRRLVKTVLEEFGYKVIEAVDGDDAINRFKENKDEIDIVILDVIMPKKNGREAYNELKNIKPDIKTIFISGYTEDIIKNEDIVENGFNFIAKPVSPTDLLKRIREVMDK
ncbi:MAG: response regulator [Nitrospirae bacterium]|nr:response regulator [Nitrospirota bacterium]